MILTIPVILLLFGAIMKKRAGQWKGDHWIIWNIVWALLLSLGIMFVLVIRVDTATYKEKREALQGSYERARQLSDFERVSITRDIADFNKDLALLRYWNDTWMIDLWIDDVVEDIEPIE